MYNCIVIKMHYICKGNWINMTDTLAVVRKQDHNYYNADIAMATKSV